MMLQTLHIFDTTNLLNEIKRKKPETKVLVISDEENSQKEFYDLGVDDVIIRHRNETDLLLTIDIASKKIEYDDKIVSLNGKTFDILVYLALRNQRVFSKDEIINALWEEPGYKFSSNVSHVKV